MTITCQGRFFRSAAGSMAMMAALNFSIVGVARAEVDEREFMVPYLASVYGGDVPVRKDEKGRLKPEVSVYRVRLSLDDRAIAPDQILTGYVQIEGQPSSVAKRAWDQVVATVVRESGF